MPEKRLERTRKAYDETDLAEVIQAVRDGVASYELEHMQFPDLDEFMKSVKILVNALDKQR